MVSVRRIYTYLVAAISLWAASSAVVALVQNIIPPSPPIPIPLTAGLIAVIVIALPFYLGHWLWAQRLAARDAEERGSLIRRLYLYFMLATFLGWFLTNGYDLISEILRLILRLETPRSFLGGINPAQPLEILLNAAVAMIVAMILWVYHELITRSDERALPDAEHISSVKRVYIYYFSAVGLLMTAWGISQILRLVLYQVGGSRALDQQVLVNEVARIVVGLPLWIIFWSWGQRLFFGNQEERESAVRKLYLYFVVFIAALITVSTATMIFAGLLRQQLQLRASGDIRDVLSIGIVTALVWAFHWFVLRQETAMVDESERQAGLRRLYWYLVAAIGLGAFLIGLGGLVSVLISLATGESFGDGQKEIVAWCTAAIVAGLPVWLIPWRKAQNLALQENAQGEQERRSVVRKGYLYLFLLLATLTMLGCAIWILTQFVSIALGERPSGNIFTTLAYPFAYALIAAGVWVIHGLALRGDSTRFQKAQNARRADFSIGIVDAGEAKFGNALVAELNRKLPGLTIVPQGFGAQAAGENAPSLAQAKVIVGAWTMFAGDNAQAASVRASEAQKWIVPTPMEGAQWIGVDAANAPALAQDAARAVKQLLEGEAAKTRRGLHPAVIIVLVLIGLCVLLPLIFFIIQRAWLGF